jgi:hypothetical protein
VSQHRRHPEPDRPARWPSLIAWRKAAFAPA